MTSVCWQITFSPKEAPSETFCNFLDDFFEVNAQNYTDNDYDEYIGYQSGHFDEREMLVQAAKREIILPPYKIEKLTSENWLKDYVIKFDPFEVADFCIYGIHETTPPQTTKIPLQIYAATAFGSNHQTTQSCIRALCELYYDGFKPQCILDIGTGSGILSLCAAKLWPAAKILATDIDEEAIIVTKANAKTNNLSSQIESVLSDGYKNLLIESYCPADLILCNIFANPLISFAPDLSCRLKSNGFCILSGFVDDQSQDVISAHEKKGLFLIKMYSFDNWRAALMQKGLTK